MNNQIFKTILFGALVGAAIFAAPFFALKVFIFFLIVGFFIRIFRGRSYYHRRGWRGPWGWAYADKIRAMSDQEYQEFKEKFGRPCRPEDFRKNDDSDSEIQKA